MLWFRSFAQLSIGVVILVSGMFAGLYYMLKYDNGQSIKNATHALEKEKNVVQKDIDSLKLELKQLQEMDRAMNLMGEEINKFLQYIPQKLTSAMILNHLNIHAKASGVNLENIISHRAIEKHEFYEKIKVSVTVKGLYTQVLVFLSKLTGLTEIVSVEHFALTEVQGKGKYVGGLNEVTMKMDIYGYRYTSQIIDMAAENKQKEVKQ